MPEQTMFAFAEHGRIEALMSAEATDARDALRAAAAAGADVEALR